MASRIRSGLYKVVYQVDPHATITYSVERNSGEYERDRIGDWVVTYEIEPDRPYIYPARAAESGQFDRRYATKREALAAIAEVEAGGRYEYDRALGWVYRRNG